MAKPRAPKLETATARRKLAIRKKPYWLKLAPTIALGFRRNAGPGTWSVRSTDGHGSDWIKRIGLADDQEPADGGAVLTFWQAQDRARALARGQTGDDGDRPITVIEALERDEADLVARGGDPTTPAVPACISPARWRQSRWRCSELRSCASGAMDWPRSWRRRR